MTATKHNNHNNEGHRRRLEHTHARTHGNLEVHPMMQQPLLTRTLSRFDPRAAAAMISSALWSAAPAQTSVMATNTKAEPRAAVMKQTIVYFFLMERRLVCRRGVNFLSEVGVVWIERSVAEAVAVVVVVVVVVL